MTREQWLHELMAKLAPAFAELGKPLPTGVKLSCGYTSKGAKGRRIGECHYCEADRREIFIKPDQHESEEVAAIVLHELIHAALGPGFGHGREFKKIAVKLGLEGRMTATIAGDKAKALVRAALEGLEAYPHTKLLAGEGRARATTPAGKRHVNMNCPDCGFHAKVLADQT